MVEQKGKPDIALAKYMSIFWHQGQTREISGEPYCHHPEAVVQLLLRHGYCDETTICAGYLHDSLEMSLLDPNTIENELGYEVANGVIILSQKVNFWKFEMTREEYLWRLDGASDEIKRIKISDVIHNTLDLEHLPQDSIEKKMTESKEFYIPWGKAVAPIMVLDLEKNIAVYREKRRNHPNDKT